MVADFGINVYVFYFNNVLKAFKNEKYQPKEEEKQKGTTKISDRPTHVLATQHLFCLGLIAGSS